MNCTYTIAIDSERTTLELAFEEIDIEYDPDCVYDALAINGEKLCGTSADNITRKYPVHGVFPSTI